MQLTFLENMKIYCASFLLLLITANSLLPAQNAQQSATSEAQRMAEPGVRGEHPHLEPIYWQVAPFPITEARLPSETASTQRHFRGDSTVAAEDTVLTRNIPEVDNQLSQMDPFFRDSSLVLNLRSAFFRTDNVGGRLESSWALGGNLVYKSGWFKDFVSLGAGYYTSSGLYKPYGQQGTRLLKASPDGGQHSQNVLGQAYVELKHDIYRAKFYRQALDTPFINEHYDRMLPQLFEAYVIGTKTIQPDEKGGINLKYNKDYPVSFLAGYVAEELDRGSTTFVPMSSVATGNTTSTNRGVAFGGLQITPLEPVSIDLWNYYGVDMFNTFYAEGDFDFPLDREGDWMGKLAVQFADQRTVGEAIVGDWSTQMAGLFAGSSYKGLSLSFRFNHVFDGTGSNTTGGPAQFGFQSPWGRYPGFTKSTLLDYRDPESTMYGLFASYDFGELSSELAGLKFATSYVFQSRPDTGAGRGPDQNEFDLILQYKPSFIKGLSFDIRGSFVSAYDAPTGLPSAPAVNDYRFTVNYTLPLL